MYYKNILACNDNILLDPPEDIDQEQPLNYNIGTRGSVITSMYNQLKKPNQNWYQKYFYCNLKWASVERKEKENPSHIIRSRKISGLQDLPYSSHLITHGFKIFSKICFNRLWKDILNTR